MPEIGRIQSTNFQALLTRLGITRNAIPFSLRSEVSPVVVVGGEISITASPSPAYRVTDVFTVGIVVAPVINTILADTGPLPAGPYTVQWIISVREASILSFEWRDAGNAVNLWTHQVETTPANIQFSTRLNVENDNERFRIRVGTNGTAAIDYQATILAKI